MQTSQFTQVFVEKQKIIKNTTIFNIFLEKNNSELIGNGIKIYTTIL